MRRILNPLPLAAAMSLLAGAPSVAAPASADSTKILVREDGVKVIVNEPSAARSRRMADRLLPAPSAEMEAAIVRHAAGRDLDSKLVQALVQVESGYNVDALSNKGAMGLMQLMPGTARDLGVENPWDFDQNLAGGTAYLRQMLDRFGEPDLALAAYTAGPEAVARHSGIPPYQETRDYVQRILRLWNGSDAELDGRRVLITRDANNRIRLTTASVGKP